MTRQGSGRTYRKLHLSIRFSKFNSSSPPTQSESDLCILPLGFDRIEARVQTGAGTVGTQLRMSWCFCSSWKLPENSLPVLHIEVWSILIPRELCHGAESPPHHALRQPRGWWAQGPCWQRRQAGGHAAVAGAEVSPSQAFCTLSVSEHLVSFLWRLKGMLLPG